MRQFLKEAKILLLFLHRQRLQLPERRAAAPESPILPQPRTPLQITLHKQFMVSL